MIFDDDVNDYLDAALFTSTDESDEGGGEPLDRNFGTDDFTEAARHQAKVELEMFDEEVQRVLAAIGDEEADSLDLSNLGSDFWYSRNGHGVGFFDRPERYGKEVGDALQALAKRFGERHVEIDEQYEDGDRPGLSFFPPLSHGQWR